MHCIRNGVLYKSTRREIGEAAKQGKIGAPFRRPSFISLRPDKNGYKDQPRCRGGHLGASPSPVGSHSCCRHTTPTGAAGAPASAPAASAQEPTLQVRAAFRVVFCPFQEFSLAHCAGNGTQGEACGAGAQSRLGGSSITFVRLDLNQCSPAASHFPYHRHQFATNTRQIRGMQQ